MAVAAYRSVSDGIKAFTHFVKTWGRARQESTASTELITMVIMNREIADGFLKRKISRIDMGQLITQNGPTVNEIN